MIRTLGTEFAHFFLLEQDGEVALIDAGLSGYRDTLEPALAEMGRSIDDVKAIVLTHADPDHVGFAGELQASHGIPVHVHRADSERTRQGKTKHTEVSPLAMLTMLKHAHSRRALRHMIANGGAKQSKIPEVIPFDDGDKLDVPGRLRVEPHEDVRDAGCRCAGSAVGNDPFGLPAIGCWCIGLVLSLGGRGGAWWWRGRAAGWSGWRSPCPRGRSGRRWSTGAAG